MELEQTEVGVDGVVGDSSPTDAPTADGSDRQPEQPTEQQKVNLDEIEEFRQWKSESDKRVTAAQQQAQAAQAEAARLKAEADQARMQTMSDEEKYKYLYEQSQAELSSFRQQSEQQLLMTQKEQQLAQVMAETGVSREDIENAATPSEAWQIGLAHLKAQSGKTTKAVERQEKVAANSADIGGGTAPPTKDVRSKVQDAIADGDMAAIFKAHTS